MSSLASAPTSNRRQQRRRRMIFVATVVLVAAILIGLRGYPLLEARSSPTPSLPTPSLPSPSTPTSTRAQTRYPSVSATPPGGNRSVGREPYENHHEIARERSTTLADGTTAFDDVPAVAELDPDLLSALRRATTAAARDDVDVTITSGWRSRADQDRLFREAIVEYGSKAEAARWVAAPGTSPHEAGEAVDLGPSAATAWLARHGALYGLCQIYRNEPWHFELRPHALDRGCPAMYADPTDDPRMGR